MEKTSIAGLNPSGAGAAVASDNQDCHMELAEIESTDFGAYAPRPTPRWILKGPALNVLPDDVGPSLSRM
jgi:hypothetical protein